MVHRWFVTGKQPKNRKILTLRRRQKNVMNSVVFIALFGIFLDHIVIESTQVGSGKRFYGSFHIPAAYGC